MRLSALGRSVEILGDVAGLEQLLQQAMAPVWTPQVLDEVDKAYRLKRDGEGWAALDVGGEEEFLVALGPAELVAEMLALEIERWWCDALPDKVVLHAGAVAIEGLAILLPGRGGAGKTTLVRELLRRGGEYLSDDHAVIDLSGRVWPYPTDLKSLEGGQVVRLPPKTIGARVAGGPLPLGLIVATEYQETARWTPREMSPGEAAAFLLAHTFSAASRPELAMTITTALVEGCSALRSPRSEAGTAAAEIITELQQRRRGGSVGMTDG